MTLYYLVVGVAALLAFSVLVVFRDRSFALANRTVALLNTMLSKVEDSKKQKLLIKELGSVLRTIFIFLLVLMLAVFAGLAPVFGYSYFSADPFSELDFSSGYFYLSLSIGSIAPFLPLMLRKSDSDYSDTSKLLHRIILDNQNISMALYGIEKKIYAKKIQATNKEYVIVSGLARAGTTALTALLHRAGNFHSLSYANMPFLLAPNLWSRIYKVNGEKLKERSHGDRVQFGLNSVEALEEYFWKVSLEDSFIKDSSLQEHEVEKEVHQDYLRYQDLVKPNKENDSVYLAKNNNMMLRYGALRRLDPSFRMIVMFRRPLDHANSLLQQHLRFAKLQKEDPFVLEYMNWLGHHEFGMGQKQFDFKDSKISLLDKKTLDYWLEVWIDYYRSVRKHFQDSGLFLVAYEDFLEDPKSVFQQIGNVLNIELKLSKIQKFQGNPKEAYPEHNTELVEQAEQLYRSMYDLRIEA